MYMPKEKGTQKKTEDKAMWNKGSIKIENQIFTYSAKVYGEPSEDYGIDGGKISKLEIRPRSQDTTEAGTSSRRRKTHSLRFLPSCTTSTEKKALNRKQLPGGEPHGSFSRSHIPQYTPHGTDRFGGPFLMDRKEVFPMATRGRKPTPTAKQSRSWREIPGKEN